VPATAADLRTRLPQDEVIYFLLADRFENGDPSNDRGGLFRRSARDRLRPRPTRASSRGDLKGLTRRLDYLEALGVTAIWLRRSSRTSRCRAVPETRAPAITAIG
jgi:hypothetical protein